MTSSRWDKAQTYERDWWQTRAAAMDLEFYVAFAGDMRRELDGILTLSPETRILEIGSGAAGILTHLDETPHRHAIDPLEDFYASVERFQAFRDPAVQYYTGVGEKLDFAADHFDLIIMDNVLDHCADPGQVLDEMARVLKPGGIVYFRQNTYHAWGQFVRFLMERIQFDKGHPHTFSKAYLQRHFNRLGLSTSYYHTGGYWSTWKSEIRSSRTFDRIKALLCATRDRTLYILRRPA
ncbi:MAG: methyltransferase domain-containing protein [Candidatus Latescibacteria bacterium]|nr:methyltransferase domain-containing protein [Candidatus Latescibacterota bacterium]